MCYFWNIIKWLLFHGVSLLLWSHVNIVTIYHLLEVWLNLVLGNAAGVREEKKRNKKKKKIFIAGKISHITTSLLNKINISHSLAYVFLVCLSFFSLLISFALTHATKYWTDFHSLIELALLCSSLSLRITYPCNTSFFCPFHSFIDYLIHNSVTIPFIKIKTKQDKITKTNNFSF